MKVAFPDRRINRSIVLAGLLVWFGLGATPAIPAHAAEVHFDPDSPAGKEYALPLPQARNEALGNDGIDGPPPSEAPLFGVGVSSANGEGAPAGTGSRGQASGERTGGDEAGRGAAGSGTPGPNGPTGSSQARDGSSYSLGAAAAMIAAVIVAALLLGLALRYVSRLADRRSGREAQFGN